MLAENDAVREIVNAHVTPPATPEEPISLSSLDVILIARDIEKRFSIRVAANEFRPENFRSMAAITEFVRRKTRAA